jgi:transposase
MMWDNLASHLSPLVTHVVGLRNQIPNRPTHWSIVPRPPYQPKFGPIEYIFCELPCELKCIAQLNWDTAKLRQEIFNIAARIGRDGSFDRTFEHCGYDP